MKGKRKTRKKPSFFFNNTFVYKRINSETTVGYFRTEDGRIPACAVPPPPPHRIYRTRRPLLWDAGAQRAAGRISTRLHRQQISFMCRTTNACAGRRLKPFYTQTHTYQLTGNIHKTCISFTLATTAKVARMTCKVSADPAYAERTWTTASLAPPRACNDNTVLYMNIMATKFVNYARAHTIIYKSIIFFNKRRASSRLMLFFLLSFSLCFPMHDYDANASTYTHIYMYMCICIETKNRTHNYYRYSRVCVYVYLAGCVYTTIVYTRKTDRRVQNYDCPTRCGLQRASRCHWIVFSSSPPPLQPSIITTAAVIPIALARCVITTLYIIHEYRILYTRFRVRPWTDYFRFFLLFFFVSDIIFFSLPASYPFSRPRLYTCILFPRSRVMSLLGV